MIKLVLALRDVRAEVFLPPFVVPTLGVAYRDLADAVSRRHEEGNVLAKHPEDFELFQLGTYDDELGKLSPFAQPSRLLPLESLQLEPSEVVGRKSNGELFGDPLVR